MTFSQLFKKISTIKRFSLSDSAKTKQYFSCVLVLSGAVTACSTVPDAVKSKSSVAAESAALAQVYLKMDELVKRAAPPEVAPDNLKSLATWQAEQQWWEEVPQLASQLIAECLQLTGCDHAQVAGFQADLISRQSEMLKIHQDLLESVRTDMTLEPELDEEAVAQDDSVSSESAQELASSERLSLDEMDAIHQTDQLIKGADFTQMITVNEPVKAALDDWLTWGRPNLMSAYENYQYLRPLISPVYEKAGFPEALLFAMIATESTGKAHAKSTAGAAGLLQFMRFTGLRYGLGVVDGFDQRFDPVMATKANALYMNEHLRKFHNSLEKTLAAYNGGENRMLGLQKKNPGKSVWDKNIFYALPKETREYVPKVLAAAWLFMHPEQYRVEFTKVNNTLTDLAITKHTSLSELTLCLGQKGASDGWFRTLRNLNPTIRPEDVIEPGNMLLVPEEMKPIYQTQCDQADESFLKLAKEIHKANYPEGGNMTFYVVRKGDTANRIASRFECVSTRELTELNNIRPPHYRLKVGQVLQVPEC